MGFELRRGGRGVRTTGPVSTAVIGFPYWIQHRRKGSTFDFRVLDALNGERVNIGVHRALVSGFVAARAATTTNKANGS